MENKPAIVLCGSIAIDRIMDFHGHYKDLIQPDKIHVLSLSVLVDRLTHSRGGTAANIAYTLSLLGENPTLLGAVGQDADLYVDALATQGINITHVYKSNLPTASFTVLTDEDNNQVGGFYPGAMSDPHITSLKSWYHTNSLIVISAHDPKMMQKQVRECQEQQMSLVYDIGQQVSNVPVEDLIEGIHAATILMVNDYELTVLANRTGMSESAIKESVPLVVTTLGKHGSRIEGKQALSPITIGIIPGVRPVDPTGAGDAYRAGFLYGYVRNWDLKICGQLGATCAAYAVETRGTQEHAFTDVALAKRYTKAFNESLPTN